nr:YetF domain-containing protein [Pseudomonas luteola]
MDAVLRAAAVYLVVFVIFKIAGRRTLAEITTFDFVLLLIIGEATQQALLGDDFSVTNAALIIVTLVVIDIGLSLVKERSPKLARFIDGMPMIIVENGQLLKARLNKVRLAEEDILEAARTTHGLERMDQIKYAILEKNGAISIIPKEK